MMRSTLTLMALSMLAVTSPTVATAQTIDACVSASGKLRIVDDPASCKRKESPLSWSSQGPQGEPGETGAQGLQGPQGPAGSGEPTIPATCTAAARIKIDDVTPANGSIEAYAYSFGVVYDPPDTPGPGGTGVTTFQTVNFTKAIDTTTPLLFEHAVEGKVHAEGTLEVLDGSGTPVLTYTMEEVVILSVTHGGPVCGTAPAEALALTFKTIELE